MGIRHFFFWALVFTTIANAADVTADLDCPHDALETCHWRIGARVLASSSGPVIKVNWSKSVISRHRDKPLARALSCNVDRAFDAAAGGYIEVWFEGERLGCNPMKQSPADCGVRFQLEDPRDLSSASGFTVKAPAGKKLAKVEHFSTLDIQCGNFARTDYAQAKWASLLGWRADAPGDGIYTKNGAPK